ncbi:hypothetical protein D9758_007632 [Tetrapyrgos nigripes]|uniref:Uncharacterized protein n=1 Tax=Tetrapyrgos nigripes TaxID=182062 RepID=A0A8H5G7V0_9AGAR|nr:hypothetical protein D9758_007632 [Tetrapyrgos nigripes]
MPFPFTFSFAVPGLSNPFATPSPPDPKKAGPSNSQTNGSIDDDILNLRNSTPNPANNSRDRRTPSHSRKRGWEPSFAEPSQSTTTLTSSNGYLDTPAKYREMAEAQGLNMGYEAYQHIGEF